MASLLEYIDKLKFWCAELEPRRSLDPLANDVYEEVADLRELAETILRGDTRANYPARVRQERECIRKLQEFWSEKAAEELRHYESVFEVAQEVLKVRSEEHTSELQSLR